MIDTIAIKIGGMVMDEQQQNQVTHGSVEAQSIF